MGILFTIVLNISFMMWMGSRGNEWRRQSLSKHGFKVIDASSTLAAGQLGRSQSLTGFAPAENASRWTRGLLVGTLVLAIVAVFSSAATMGVLDVEGDPNDSRRRLIGSFQI